MFETLFTYPSVLNRHREGPLAAERREYLSKLVAKGHPQGTILHRSSYCLCIAKEVAQWPPDHCFEKIEVEKLAEEWAVKRHMSGRASSPQWPKANFQSIAMDFLRCINRLRPAPPPKPGRYQAELDDFITAQQKSRWLSEATCRAARWQITRFLNYLEQCDVSLGDVDATDIDAFFEHMAQRWSRVSLRTSAKMLRAWFDYCAQQGWTRTGLAKAILTPRIYRHEGLPLGPTWEDIGSMLAETSTNDPASLRDHAIILLLSVYGMRSGTVRRLHLNDLDWAHNRIHFIRSKSRRKETAPLEPRVGNAIARYLRYGRPCSDSRVVFLTLRAPRRPLSAGGLYDVVRRHLPKQSLPKKGRGPHGLRHACARHLVESGRSLKEVGDHLGHRSPDSTRFYTKVDLTSLRKVAFVDLGGLA